MVEIPTIRLCALAGLMTAMTLGMPSAARAQFQPRSLNDPATGEKYRIEAAAGFWFPSAQIVVASESLGIRGTSIDLKQDFALRDRRFPSLQLVLRPTRHSKFKLQYIPIAYDATGTLSREVVFNGQRYRIGLPVNAVIDWKAYRLGYEYDFVVLNRGFVGAVLDVKYTDMNVRLRSPLLDEFVEAKAPIPAVGGIARVYVVPNISVTAEMTGFSLGWLPRSVVKDNQGHYVDFDIFGTLNFTNNIGVQAGYRSLDVGYALNTAAAAQCPALPSGNSGCLTLRGPYLGVVARY